MPSNAPGDRAEPAPSGDKPAAGRLATVLGAVMALEGVCCAVVSIPFLVFGGFGVLGLITGAAQVWVGLVLMGVVSSHPKGAAIASLVVGGAIAFIALVVMAFASCASIVNCGSGSDVPMFVAAAIAAAINLLGAALLWKRKVQPQG